VSAVEEGGPHVLLLAVELLQRPDVRPERDPLHGPVWVLDLSDRLPGHQPPAAAALLLGVRQLLVDIVLSPASLEHDDDPVPGQTRLQRLPEPRRDALAQLRRLGVVLIEDVVAQDDVEALRGDLATSALRVERDVLRSVPRALPMEPLAVGPLRGRDAIP